MANQKGLKGKQLRDVSSPGKVYKSRASKPLSISAVSTADGSDAATTQALANALKAKLNLLIAALKK